MITGIQEKNKRCTAAWRFLIAPSAFSLPTVNLVGIGLEKERWRSAWAMAHNALPRVPGQQHVYSQDQDTAWTVGDPAVHDHRDCLGQGNSQAPDLLGPF